MSPVGTATKALLLCTAGLCAFAQTQPPPSTNGVTAPAAHARRSAAPIVNAAAVQRIRRAPKPNTAANPKAGADTVIVCAARWLPTLQPWLDHRRLQGHRFAHVEGQLSSRQIHAEIKELARSNPLRYVVIFGDADPNMIVNPQVRARCVPTFYVAAKVNTKWGSEPHIATDNPYADLDGDHIPDVAIGRISFDTQEQLRRIIEKTIRYERQPNFGLWQRRVTFVAGLGGFGPLADSAIEASAKRFITEMIPPDYATSMTYGSWRSPYCPDPRAFRETVLRRLQTGSLFWVYMGHGHPDRLDRLKFGDSVVPILESGDVPRVRSQSGLPIAILLACYTGAYDQDEDCLAERLLREPQGPVGVICGSRVTMPYGMAVLGTALMDGYFAQRMDRLGDVFLHAKRALTADRPTDDGHRRLLDTVAKTLTYTKGNLEAERTEHRLMFQLMGDPLLRIPQPEPVSLQVSDQVAPGDRLRISGVAPFAGKCLVELVCRRDRLTIDAPRRLHFDNDNEALNKMTSIYARANDHRWNGKRIDVAAGRFDVDIPVPSHANGASHVRLFIEGNSRCALGSAPVMIQSKAKDRLRLSNTQR